MNRNKVVKLTENVKQFLVVDSGFGRSATPVIREGESFGDMLGFFWMNTADVYDDNGKFVSHSSDGTPLVTPAGGLCLLLPQAIRLFLVISILKLLWA